MKEFPENLWAPWRMEYIESLKGTEGEESGGCFLCDYRASPESDERNHVICRTPRMLMLMNRFPYTNGHLLIAPLAHKADLAELDAAEMAALMASTRDAQDMLTRVLSPHGFNVGMNFGRCAGAGLPGHLHMHVVPRWNGDTNFMAVLGDVRVIPQAMDRLYQQLRAVAEEELKAGN